MNVVTIFLKNGNNVVLYDESENKEELSEKLSNLYSMNKVVIVKTEEKSVIIRPSDVIAIEINVLSDNDDTSDQVNDQESQEENRDKEIQEEEEKKEEDEHIDIITDMD